MGVLKNIGFVSLTTVLSIVVLFLLTKLMGAKQVSQMTMFDYVEGITIGSVAAELATDLDAPLNSLTALVIYGLAAVGISLWTSHSLTARRVFTGKPLVLLENGRNPVRVICDTHLRTPPQAQVVTTADQIPTILATCCAAPEKQAVYRKAGCQVLCLNEKNGHVDLRQLMERLGREQIDSILLEGGGTLNWAALECGIVQQVQAYIAPKLFGGKDAKTPVEGVGVPAPDDAFRLKNSRLERLGEDLLIESEVEYPCSQES